MLIKETTHSRCIRCAGLLITQRGIEEGDNIKCIKCSRVHYIQQRPPVSRNLMGLKTLKTFYGGTKKTKPTQISVNYRIKKSNGHPLIKIVSVLPPSDGELLQLKNLKIRKKHHASIRNRIFKETGLRVMSDDDFFPVE